jgi:hypothetical protein
VTNKTKIALATTLIAAFATPALAHEGYRAKHETSYTTAAARFVEGRNAAIVGNTGTTTDRESMVHAN